MPQKPVSNKTLLVAVLAGFVLTISSTAQAQISISAAVPQG